MSSLERERWLMGQERWPNLQLFLSKEIPDVLLGSPKELAGMIRAKLSGHDAISIAKIARECWDFLASFKDRHDDFGFLRDGFGVLGKKPSDNRGKGHAALARVKLLYDVLAEEVRAQRPDWTPAG